VLKEKNDRNEREKTGQNNIDSELTPEIQIRRLTAQLTAAYQRIAELEEQLMAKRVYS
jgi:predicted  nucleic acid-binding Zn-ribbon protein